ncbi:2-(1,2-epoxy-1,2-dihydrophenyl)acetyl-CoA isomerase [Rhodoligotrophos appendicifer]|uniref:enoyl-CoA hydratase/isomerase family protein n=1 Tax=Rhodoligotrophos appendicifer TaxID=987056 RepID=UPI00118684BB|nr:enoyl-CoA hydratase-related protein [Rhodoligotrophos appendicifer]
MSDFVEVEDRGAVRIIAVNRPDVRNAINTAVLLQMRKAVKEAAAAEHLRAIVFTGRGGAFSAGADVKEWADKIKGIDPHPDNNWVEEACMLVHDVYALRKPTIAMIDGAAVGAGLDMALACDFRVASTKSKFICAYTKIGYPPDAGGSWLMPRVMGIENAKMFAYTGDLYDGVKAKEVGLVTMVVEPAELEAETMKLAEKLASGPTVAQGLAKHLIDTSHARSLSDQQRLELELGRVCAKTEDHKEGLAAANERRSPVFVGR